MTARAQFDIVVLTVRRDTAYRIVNNLKVAAERVFADDPALGSILIGDAEDIRKQITMQAEEFDTRRMRNE